MREQPTFKKKLSYLVKPLLALSLSTCLLTTDISSPINASAATTKYTVKKGDSLWLIAYYNNTTVAKIKKLNNLKTDVIKIGTKLKVPKTTTKKITKTSNANVSDTSKKPVTTTTTTPQKTIATSKVSNYTKKEKATIERALAYGNSYLGIPYAWGGSSPDGAGFDCSGLIYYIFAKAGTSIGRTTSLTYYNAGQSVTTPTRGDIVYFKDTSYKGQGISHMGVYIGNNQFLHAGVTGGVQYTSLSVPYWSTRFVGFKKLHIF